MPGIEQAEDNEPMDLSLSTLLKNRAEREKSVVNCPPPANHKQYFGTEKFLNRSVSTFLPKVARVQRNRGCPLCVEKKEKIVIGEAAIAHHLSLIRNLEEEIEIMEVDEMMWEMEEEVSRKIPQLRGDQVSMDSGEAHEMSSDESSCTTGDIIFPADQLTTIPTAPVSPASTVGVELVQRVVVPPSYTGGRINGITAREYSVIYPGRMSCVIEVDNFENTVPLLDPQSVDDRASGLGPQVSGGCGTSFAAEENGNNKVTLTMSYQVDQIRLAFALNIDDVGSYFRIGFIPCIEDKSALEEYMADKEWIQEKIASSQEGPSRTDYEGIHLMAYLTEGAKAYFALKVIKIGPSL